MLEELNINIDQCFGAHFFGLIVLDGINRIRLTSKLYQCFDSAPESPSLDWLLAASQDLNIVLTRFKNLGYQIVMR
ncbi:hypothetical protein A4G19_01940 [Pasteurellaceae bacterium Macca]|nr:hypothetical protein [Pasteurellaceae bacterium Macca]